MTASILQRLHALEEAALHSEGAHYALHDLMACALAQIPEEDSREMLQRLASQVSVHADRIGAIRLAGYRQELESLDLEIRHRRQEKRRDQALEDVMASSPSSSPSQ